MHRVDVRRAWPLLLVVPLLSPAADPPPLPRDTLPPVLDLSRRPRGLAELPTTPDDNPLTQERVRLGRRLFFDPVLSRDRTISCASCHLPDRAFAGADAVALGIEGRRGRRNAPSLLNAAYGSSFFWDGRTATLEEQALQPIANPLEMDSTPEEAVRRLRADPAYAAQFREAFGDEGVTRQNLARALAGFQRALLSGDNAVDRFRHGESGILTEAERQGMWLFESRAGCWRCHSGDTFSDGRLHNTGVGWGKPGADPGRFEVTRRESDRGAFKTPTLRNVERTAPYMHDGSMATLEDVVKFYNQGGTPNPNLDPVMKPLKLNDTEVAQLAAFLRALTDRPANPPNK